MIIKEKVIKYGDNVDTDVIIPARYLNTIEEDELARHCFEDLDQDFREKAKGNKIIVAGDNFGCGSSREHAPLAIKASGIKLIIANTFVIPSPEAAKNIKDRDEIKVDMDKGTIMDLTTEKTFEINPVPDFIQEIITSGGYINYTKKKLGIDG
jgi:3-isopropylmalate/(R)-2-methylmalate dehydratase small subunit